MGGSGQIDPNDPTHAAARATAAMTQLPVGFAGPQDIWSQLLQQGMQGQGLVAPINTTHLAVLNALKNLVGHSPQASGENALLGMEQADAELIPGDNDTPIPPLSKRTT